MAMLKRGLRGILIGYVAVSSAVDASAQTHSVRPSYGVVQPLVIHAVDCHLVPMLPLYRPDCEHKRVLRRRERYFNVDEGAKLDIVVRQLESADRTRGLPTDLIGLAAVPLDAGVAEQLPVEERFAQSNGEAGSPPFDIAPGAGPVQESDFQTLSRGVILGPRQVLEVQVDVKHVPSGEYQEIIAARTITNDGTEVVPVPLTLRVKDYFPLPLFVLLFGIGVGLWVSSYVSRKKDVDEIIIQSDQLQRQTEIEPTLPDSFRVRVENDLRNVLFDLRRTQVEQARTHLASAYTLWEKWRMRPREWVELFDTLGRWYDHADHLLHREGHEQRLTKAKDEIDRIRRSTLQDEVKYEDVRVSLDLMVERLERFLQLRAEVTTLVRNLEQLDEDQRAGLVDQVDGLRSTFASFTIEDDGGAQQLAEALDPVRNEVLGRFREAGRERDMEEATPPAPPRAAAAEPRSTGALRPVQQLVSAAHWTTAAARSRFRFRFGSARGAIWRRNAFNATGYTVLMIVLAGSGFHELYSQNPIFGANGFSDYMTLFAWGFGAEATRSSFTQLMSSWGHPAGARAA